MVGIGRESCLLTERERGAVERDVCSVDFGAGKFSSYDTWSGGRTLGSSQNPRLYKKVAETGRLKDLRRFLVSAVSFAFLFGAREGSSLVYFLLLILNVRAFSTSELTVGRANSRAAEFAAESTRLSAISFWPFATALKSCRQTKPGGGKHLFESQLAAAPQYAFLKVALGSLFCFCR